MQQRCSVDQATARRRSRRATTAGARRPLARLIVAIGVLIGAFALGAAVAPAPARAAGGPYYVGSTYGGPVRAGDADGTACASATNTTCTLRGAFSLVADGEVVRFSSAIPAAPAPTTITLTDGGGGTITLPTVTLDGTGKQVAISGNGGRVFAAHSGVSAALTALAITGGSVPDDGGGIYNSGTLTLTNVTVSGNTASNIDGNGGGISNNGGTMRLINSTVSGNTAGRGAGIYNSGTVTVTNSTVNGNTSYGGEGIRNFGPMLLVNSTVSGNNCGISNWGALTLVSSTVGNNDECFFGTGIANYSNFTYHGTVNATSSIISDFFTYSVIGPGTALTGTNNLVGGTLLLAPLGDYGGPTQTMPPLPGSPTLDVYAPTGGSCGSYTDPISMATANVTTDQRGLARPVGSKCDIGAAESRGFTFANPTGTPQQANVVAGFGQPLGVTVAPTSGGDPVAGGTVTFALPASGASATFGVRTGCTVSMGGTVATCTITDGTATSPAFTANGALGDYTGTASTAGATGVTFSLTNTRGPAATLTASPATPLAAPVGAAFPALSVTVTDAGGNPVADGTPVAFTVTPAGGGASATLSNGGGSTTTGGVATITATANLVAGGPYTVTATSNGRSATFALTNTVSAASLGTVIDALVTDPKVVTTLKEQASAIAAAPNAGAKANKLNAFIKAVNAQTGKSITPANAAILIALARAL